MNKARLFALTTAVCLAACGTDKPAASNESATVPAPDSSLGVAAAPVAADSIVLAPAGKASIPSKAPVPSSMTTKTTTAPAAAAPVTAKPAATPAPAVQPAVQPAAKPAAPAPTVAAPSAPRADPTLGAPLYEENCRKCHGVRGVPVKAMAAKFPKMLPFDAAFFGKTTDDAVVAILTNGKGEDMKSFKDKLSRAEMASVAAYIRTLAP